MIYNKAVVAAFLLAFTTTSCEAEYTRHSRTVRGSSTEDETSRLLNPAGGKGKGGSKSSKSKKGFSGFTNPKKGEKVCLVEETTFLIEGSTTPIPSRPATPQEVPAGLSFGDCNDLLSRTCSGVTPILDQYRCIFIPIAGTRRFTLVSDFTRDRTDFYECLEDKGVINGPWFFHRDTPGSEFRFATVKGRGGACSKITGGPATATFGPKAELEFFSEEFFGTKLADFVSFEVDYSVLGQSTPKTNQYFVNMYVRTDPSSPFFYDCNFGLVPDPPVTTPPGPPGPDSDWKKLRIDLDTPLNIQTSRSGGPACGTFPTLRAFLSTYNNAVIGVGNGDTETINLVTGETSVNSNYIGLEVCWDNAQVTTKTEKFVYDFQPAA